MSEMDNRIVMLFSIITRGKARKFMSLLAENGIGFHLQSNAVGTAPSEMMDIFGFGTNDKDIVISLAPERIVNAYAHTLSRNISGNFEYGGLMLCVRLSAISRISAEIVNRASKPSERGGRRKVKSAQKNQLILVSVNQGYTDAVMETAKRAGAMGGTVLRARLVDGGVMEQLAPQTVYQEREILTIFAPATVAAHIMDDINRIHGALSDANGIVMAVPVDKAYKI
jgi:hypothetical protein